MAFVAWGEVDHFYSRFFLWLFVSLFLRNGSLPTIQYANKCISVFVYLDRRILGVSKVMLRKIFSLFRWNFHDAVGALSKVFIGLCVTEWKVDNHILSSLPVGRSRNLAADGKLKRVNDTKNLIKVTSGTGRVAHHEGNGTIGFQDKDGTDRHGKSLGILVALVQDAQFDGMITIGIAKHGKLDLATGGNINVLDPTTMRFGIVAGESTELDTPFLEFRCHVGGRTQFGRTHWSEITGMHKDACPTVTKIFVKIKGV
mmetsp:Transcript_20938/g.48365  ORF Transcript_20938/g.48365 Transcript_20938/m.48365 type:complete len:257 (-) Transcript_20938:121-891(-)